MNNPTLIVSENGETKVMTLQASRYMKITGGIVLAAFVIGELLRWYLLADPLMRNTSTLSRLNLMMNGFAIIICYVIFAVALNSKRIEIGPQRVRVRTAPLPFFGQKDFARGDIHEVLLKKNEFYPGESNTMYRSEIHVKLPSGATAPFILAIRPKAKAVDIKRWMERELALGASVEEV
jgi:hypothetical protein